MNPTFQNMNSQLNDTVYKSGKVIPATMGCRTYVLTDINGEPCTEGRGNIAPVTINLPRLGILANKDINKFFNMLDEKIELCKDNLLHRYNVLKGLKVKDLPFVCGEGLIKGSEDLNPDDSIEPILKHGTYGIGFIGIAETLVALTGKHHGESKECWDLAYKIVSRIREKCDEYKQQYKLNFSCYASPAEGLSGRFTRIDKKIYGEIPGVTDHNYYTNSYHIPVDYQISITDKIAAEGPFHPLCNGGHISYIEVDDYPSSELIEQIITTAFERGDMSYMGINFAIRYCKDCGTYMHNEEECPHCGSRNIQGVSRVTGYLALNERFTVGFGKGEEKANRISHNRDDHYIAYRKDNH